MSPKFCNDEARSVRRIKKVTCGMKTTLSTTSGKYQVSVPNKTEIRALACLPFFSSLSWKFVLYLVKKRTSLFKTGNQNGLRMDKKNNGNMENKNS